MALDATPGGANANSYLTVAEANAYMESRLFTTGWPATDAGADLDTKERALKWATRTIDANVCFVGAASTSTQALKWPRTGMLDKNGFAIPSDVVPQDLKNATAELALRLIRSDLTLGSEVGVQGITKIKAGPVELQFKDEITLEAVPDGVTTLMVPSWLCETVTAGQTGGFDFAAM